MRFIIASLFLPLLFACEKPHLNQVKNLQENKIIRIGHGGMGFPSIYPFNALPTNSLAALRKAIEIEHADGVEVDVHMTADVDFILFHDKKLEDKTDKKGYPEELNLDQLLAANYQLGFPYDLFQTESILSMDRAFEYLESLKQLPIIQLDVRNYCENFTPEENDRWEQLMSEKLLERLDNYQIKSSRIHLISISRKMCLFFMNQSSYPVSYEIKDDESLLWAIDHGVSSITINSKYLTKMISEKAHDNGIEVIAFGAKSKSGNIKLIQKNPDYIQTDDLFSLNELLAFQ